eukprot:3937429-Rhodomonas_salina.5
MPSTSATCSDTQAANGNTHTASGLTGDSLKIRIWPSASTIVATAYRIRNEWFRIRFCFSGFSS